ncbi:MAG TPA: NifB/NifX family molybdenum-iron cluster-binding protein [Methanobacterium sp.]|jgi:predicted Fe-Mo cluster-binding NifX family protein|nr:MAG: hypothetical protein FGO69_01160 [Methanobacterium sp.]HOI72455.1 NifB/NifX family molybdenum-iron cluster-binding protein [Methanobacterium sp.]HPX77647.1 NifB/NifX family molybdenum-iron cluster-binding protein [Methanobacterium sp.]
MKVAIMTDEIGLNSNVSRVFGRSPYITIIDLENNQIENETTIENPAKFEKGAGNLLADFLVNNGIDAIISGEMGPIAFYILQNAGITVYKASPLNTQKNLNLLNEGKLKEVTTISSGYP